MSAISEGMLVLRKFQSLHDPLCNRFLLASAFSNKAISSMLVIFTNFRCTRHLKRAENGNSSATLLSLYVRRPTL